MILENDLIGIESFFACNSGYVHTIPDSFMYQPEKLSSIVWTEMAQNWNKLFTPIEHHIRAVGQEGLLH